MLTQTIQEASLGMADSLILMVLALVVFGPRRLPQIGRQIGKLMYEFRKASNDFKFQMEEELRSAEEADRRKKEEERLRALALTQPAQTAESVSQVSEERPGAPGNGADDQSESPYPGEIQYPPGASAAVPETPAEETYPRIQPPTAGEQVQAARPSTAHAETTPESESAQDKPQEQQPADATEPVTRHG